MISRSSLRVRTHRLAPWFGAGRVQQLEPALLEFLVALPKSSSRPLSIFVAMIAGWRRRRHMWVPPRSAPIQSLSGQPIEPSPQGVRHRTVTELEPPTLVTFRQPMTMKPRLLGVIGIAVRYTLTPTADSVLLSRRRRPARDPRRRRHRRTIATRNRRDRFLCCRGSPRRRGVPQVRLGQVGDDDGGVPTASTCCIPG